MIFMVLIFFIEPFQLLTIVQHFFKKTLNNQLFTTKTTLNQHFFNISIDKFLSCFN